MLAKKRPTIAPTGEGRILPPQPGFAGFGGGKDL